MPPTPVPPPRRSATLNRSLGLWLLVFYGLGSIIGAGIYVLVGAVAGLAGMAAPLAFIVAGAVAALTGLSYAELSARFPEAAGAAAYVKEAFGSDVLSRLVGFAVVAVGCFLAASLSHGAVGYLKTFVTVADLPAAGAIVVGFTVIACIGVAHSLTVAAVMTAVELVGLAIVVGAGAPGLFGLGAALPQMVPTDPAIMAGVATGAFLAFFAFLGFEDIVNMAEETIAPERTLPRAILLSIVLSTLAYAVVTVVAVLAVPVETLAGSPAPLEVVVRSAGWVPDGTLAAIALIAITNGILITMVMLGRILYGMARRGWLPAGLGHVSHLTRTPLRTTAPSSPS
jgi:amino acid transporter